MVAATSFPHALIPPGTDELGFAALSTAQHLRLVVVVDQDVDISTADGVLWAMTTRADPATDIINGGGGMGQIQQPGARKTQLAPQIPLVGGIGIDATLKFEQQDSLSEPGIPSIYRPHQMVQPGGDRGGTKAARRLCPGSGTEWLGRAKKSMLYNI